MSLLSRGGVYLGLILITCLLGAGLVAQSILPLVSTPFTLTVTVKNADTLAGIAGAQINVYHQLSGILYTSGVTGIGGVVKLNALFETPLRFDVVASGYTSKSVTQTFWGPGSTTFSIPLTPTGSPGLNYIDVYCLSDGDERVANVLVTTSLGSSVTNEAGWAKVPINSGSNVIEFSSSLGPRIKVSLLWASLDFMDYQKTITPTPGSTWTAYVEQNMLNLGIPADESGDFWQWLSGSTIPGVPNWALLVAGVFLFLLRR